MTTDTDTDDGSTTSTKPTTTTPQNSTSFVLDAAVNWYHHCANRPRLKVLLNHIPSRDDVTFTHAGNKEFWYGESESGVVYYYSGHPDNPGSGFSGRSFELPTENGSVTLVGPGDSRASVANNYGFGPVVDVTMTDDPTVMERGHTFYAGSITLDLATEAVNLLDGVTLTKQGDNSPVYEPTIEDGYVAAVDNTVVPVTDSDTHGRVTTVEPDNYGVCTDVYKHANEDRWVVPVTRNDDGTIINVSDSRFDIKGDSIVQTNALR